MTSKFVLTAMLGLAFLAAPAAFADASCDVNGDGVVDGSDVDSVNAAVGSADAAADIDGDGVVSLADVSACMSQSGQ